MNTLGRTTGGNRHDYNADSICKDCCTIRLLATDYGATQCPPKSGEFVKLNHQYYTLIYNGRKPADVLSHYEQVRTAAHDIKVFLGVDNA